jgi:hypothetical protein
MTTKRTYRAASCPTSWDSSIQATPRPPTNVAADPSRGRRCVLPPDCTAAPVTNTPRASGRVPRFYKIGAEPRVQWRGGQAARPPRQGCRLDWGRVGCSARGLVAEGTLGRCALYSRRLMSLFVVQVEVSMGVLWESPRDDPRQARVRQEALETLERIKIQAMLWSSAEKTSSRSGSA